MVTKPTGRPEGRPPKYTADHPAMAQAAAEAGATDQEIADLFAVDIRTVHRWKIDYPEFCHSLKIAKEPADDRTERSLFHRANGYSYPAVKIFMPAGATEPVIVPYIEHVPPDTTAGIFWLKNRRPDQWRDKREMEHSASASLAEMVLNSMKEREGK